MKVKNILWEKNRYIIKLCFVEPFPPCHLVPRTAMGSVSTPRHRNERSPALGATYWICSYSSSSSIVSDEEYFVQIITELLVLAQILVFPQVIIAHTG